MTQPTLFDAPARAVMNGKPVFNVPAKSVINFSSGFGHKLLCDSLTFTTGSTCAFSCKFCYTPDLMQKSPHLRNPDGTPRFGAHEDIVIRREGAVESMRKQLTDRHGQPKFRDPSDRRVIYASPLVDVAANMDLVRETIEACRVILELTNWDIRLLSKSNLLPKVAEGLADHPQSKARIIYGVSTGTLDDGLAKAFESGTPLVSKRIQSLHLLQDRGHRTFGMICPSLPQTDYQQFAESMAEAIRAERCEYIWTEVINARGQSFTRTFEAIDGGGFHDQAQAFKVVCEDKAEWERYARDTFEAHAKVYAGQRGPDGTPKLRCLQYVTAESKPWWAARQKDGAILL